MKKPFPPHLGRLCLESGDDAHYGTISLLLACLFSFSNLPLSFFCMVHIRPFPIWWWRMAGCTQSGCYVSFMTRINGTAYIHMISQVLARALFITLATAQWTFSLFTLWTTTLWAYWSWQRNGWFKVSRRGHLTFCFVLLCFVFPGTWRIFFIPWLVYFLFLSYCNEASWHAGLGWSTWAWLLFPLYLVLGGFIVDEVTNCTLWALSDVTDVVLRVELEWVGLGIAWILTKPLCSLGW